MSSGPDPSSVATFPPAAGLTRFFSITSLLGIVVITAALLWTWRALAERQLLAHQGRAHADLTQALAHALWGRYREALQQSEARPPAALRDDVQLQPLRNEVRALVQGTPITAVRIHNLRGVTVTATDERPIGEDVSRSPGFLSARAGSMTSAASDRDGMSKGREQVASYVPLRPVSGGPVEAVVEVHSDVSELIGQQRVSLWQVAGVLLALLALLQGVLLVVVRRADRVIARHEQERALREQQVHHQAFHDPLTGLPNRAQFSARLSEALAMATRHGRTGALMFIDLDRFKVVNDSLGHQAGDALLQAMAQRLQAALRQGDQLFRMGGDEFTVILPQVAAAEDAAVVARRILQRVAEPVTLHEHELSVGATIGIAVFPGDGRTADELLKNADSAMYSAKGQGRGTHAFYDAEMNLRAMQRLNLEVALHKAMRDGEFTLHYQPRVAAGTREVVAVEALLRWNRPRRGVVPTAEFLGVLEDAGLMAMVGEWVLRSACQQARRWADAPGRPLRVSINVSASQFRSSGFVALLRRVLQETGVPPDCIELELTESLLIADADQASRTVDDLKALGLHVTIDDFGTGYSSLNYLRRFAVDGLKIDRSFGTDLATCERDRELVSAIVQMARALGLNVVAEGVETEAQAAFYEGIRCHELQGWLFGRPQPVHALERHLQAEAGAQIGMLFA